MTSKKSKAFKVTGSYTIQTFYTKEFAIQDSGLDSKKLFEKVRLKAIRDESKGLEGWENEWFKVIGDEFQIEHIELIEN